MDDHRLDKGKTNGRNKIRDMEEILKHVAGTREVEDKINESTLQSHG